MIIDSPIISGSYAGTGSFDQVGNTVISGSLTVTGSIIGNLTGTASFAVTASHALNVPQTSSYALNAASASYAATATSASYATIATSASYAANATSASYAQTSTSASYATNATSASYAVNATSASYAQTASYGINIVISGSVNNADYIDFNTSASFTNAVGRLGYDNGEGTLTLDLAGGNINLKIGTDLYQYVYNNTTSSLTKGQVVYVSGSQGNRIAVKLASATAELGSANTLGFVAETITAGGEGWVMTEGNLRKLNTVGLEGGKLIFLGTTPGTYTQTPPVAPNHGVRLGYAERIDATVGSIYVKIDNGYELGELHDVVDSTTSASFGDLLVRSGSVWINSKQLTGSYGVTGSINVSGSIVATNTITAQTLVVQTVTSSVVYSSGSNIFGNDLSNTQTMTGSVSVTGSLAVNNSNVILTNQTSSMSVLSASYASGSTTASYALNATSASYANNATSASYALTASYVENAQTASFVTTAQTASFVQNAVSASYAATASYASNVPETSSFAISASQAQNAVSAAYSAYALTSSYSLAGSGFPFSGSAVITGSLLVTNLGGSGSRYLVTDNSGNITSQDATASIFQVQTFTASEGQTTFTIANGYSTGLISVFINGTKLNSSEYTDTSGTNIVLLTGSFAGDIVEFNKYLPAAGVTNNSLRQTTYFTASAGQTVFSASYTPGLLDIFYNGSKLDNSEYTANNGTFFTLATASAEGDRLEVGVYSYQVGAFSGIGGSGAATQVAYFNTSNAITGSPNFTISGSTMTVTGSLLVSGSGTFTNIGPAVFSGSITSTAGFTGSFSGTATNATSASYALNTTSASYALNATTASFATQALTASSADAFTVRNTLTAQTLVVQTITSSVVYSSGSNIFGNNISNTQTFTGSLLLTGSLLSNGAIGIGTTSPTSGYSLDVNGASYFRSSTVITGSGGTYLNIRTTSSNDAAVLCFDGVNTGYVGLNVGSNTNKFVIYYGAATRMSIDATTGNVGFGTGSASYNLEISSGSASPTELAITNTNVSGAARLSLRNAERNFILTSNTTDDLLSFSYDGSNRLQFNTINQWFNSGNLGIGTNAPGFTLHTMSTGATVASLATTSATGGYTSYRYNTSTTYGYIGNGNQIVIGGAVTDMALTVESGNLLFATTAGTERMRIASGGNVGIGTTNPSTFLHILGSNTSARGQLSIQSNNVSNAAKVTWYYDTFNSGEIGTTSSDFYALATNNFLFYASGAERMRITSGGNVGIGTTNPIYKLDVSGSAGDITADTSNGTVINIHGGSISTTNHGVGIGFTRDGSQLGYIKAARENNSNEASFMIFASQTSAGAHPERMRITSTGRVGIGVTNPDAGLQVAQPGQDDQLTIGSIANNRDHAAFMCSGPNKAEILRYQSGVRLIFGSSGNISNVDVIPGGTNGVRLSAGNTSWSAYTSDERKKKNFETVPGLEAIMQVNPVKYHFKTQEDSETKKLGFIAQNIQSLIPEMVHPNGEKAEDGSDILTIIPDYILPVLTKAIQEQQAQIQSLQAEINELKNK